ncbi:acyl carrier protein [Nonomuraea angiospora]|uniref:acyl carrier protein n=1 Tax=Nonomuraea angiospora TaxID=46172 RepID=UPI0029ABEAC2|nr:acyl carrier protein [Nonomuraea angiospora]MDX3100835.1 acyl carrier protein [Nonomuraea angiospora]
MTELSAAAGLDSEQRSLIKGIVCDILEIDPAEITDDSLFQEDYDADSLRAIEILAAIERACKVTIDQAELSRMTSLNGVYAVVAEA